MEFINCSIQLNFTKTFNVTDKQFEKLFSEALAASPSYIAYDVNIDYKGIVGSTGFQVNAESVKDGNYHIKKEGSKYTIESKCKVDVELMFMNEQGFTAFKKSMSSNGLALSISSVCNNGQNRKTYWSMECDPYIVLNQDEFSIS
jgi:hypothetical protein